jgi:hypothetical protein
MFLLTNVKEEFKKNMQVLKKKKRIEQKSCKQKAPEIK